MQEKYIEIYGYKVCYTLDYGEVYISTINDIDVDEFKDRFLETIATNIKNKLCEQHFDNEQEYGDYLYSKAKDEEE